MKFGQFDSSLLNYGVASPGSSGGRTGGEGSTGTISPPRNPNDSNLMIGVDSPQLSDRSFTGSPQDLSTKRHMSEDEEGKAKFLKSKSWCSTHRMHLVEYIWHRTYCKKRFFTFFVNTLFFFFFAELQQNEEINKRARSDSDSSPYKDDSDKRMDIVTEPMPLVIDQPVVAEGSNWLYSRKTTYKLKLDFVFLQNF